MNLEVIRNRPINCESEEEAQELNNFFISNDLRRSSGATFIEKPILFSPSVKYGYRLDINNRIQNAPLSYYINVKSDIIEWKELKQMIGNTGERFKLLQSLLEG